MALAAVKFEISSARFGLEVGGHREFVVVGFEKFHPAKEPLKCRFRSRDIGDIRSAIKPAANNEPSDAENSRWYVADGRNDESLVD